MPDLTINSPEVRRWLGRTMRVIGTLTHPVELSTKDADKLQAVGRAAVGLDDLARAVIARDDAEIARLLRLYGYKVPERPVDTVESGETS